MNWCRLDDITKRIAAPKFLIIEKKTRKYPELEQAARQMTPKTCSLFFLNESREKIALPKNKKKLAMFLNKNIEVFFFGATSLQGILPNNFNGFYIFFRVPH